MTPLVREMVKMVSVANLDPTQMQWFDVTGAIKEYIGYDQKKVFTASSTLQKHDAVWKDGAG